MKTLTLLSMLGLLLVFSFRSHAQLVTVSGIVKDGNSGVSIRQLSIVEKFSGIGTITSPDGGFMLSLKSGKVELNFFDEKHESTTVEFNLRNDTTIQVMVKPITADLERKLPRKAGIPDDQNKMVAMKGRNK